MQAKLIGYKLSHRTARWIVWSATALYLVLGSSGVVLQGLTGRTTFNLGLPLIATTGVILVPWIIIGAIIVHQRPNNPVGWLLILSVVTWAPQMLSFGLIAYALGPGVGAFSSSSLAILTLGLAMSGQPYTLLSFALLFLIFPTGRLLSRRWVFVGWASLAGFAGSLAIQPLRPDLVDPGIGLASPIALDISIWEIIKPFYGLSVGIAVASLFSGAVSLILRFRRSTGVERQQLKWFVFSMIPVVVSFMMAGFIDSDPMTPLLFASIVAFTLSLLGMAVAIAFAVLRYRLYDIDVLINRSLVYGALTACLALVYFGSVVVFENLTRGLTRQESPVAVVLSTLLVAAFFNPLRLRLQTFIDQRFYRRKYDAAIALARFSAALRDDVDPEAISSDLLGVVAETLQPGSLHLWLRLRP